MAEDVKLVMRYRVEANAPLAYQKPILLMEGDKRANVLQISLFDGEKAVDLAGLSVGGSVLRADGADVAIEGEIDGNVISCVLSEYAYAVAGPFKAFVQLLDSLGDVKRTVLLLAGMVESRGHGPQIDTGKELPSLDDILAQLETMRNVTQAANTAAGDANTAAAAANSAASKATGAANSATTAAGTANAAADRANDAAQNWEEGTVKNAESLGGVPAGSYALKTDKAPDAEKLGGKVPEYYLTPVNLLDNSNFANPVNQRGIQNGQKISDETYFLDRWVNRTAEASYTLNGGLVVESLSTMSQRIEKIAEGKTVTFAAKLSSGIITTVTGVVSYNPNGEWKRICNISNQYLDLYIDTIGGLVECVIYNSAQNTILWAALYEGSYTAETLPPYVPKGYGTELVECQRYYQNFISCRLTGNTLADGRVFAYLPYRVPMRTKATVTNPTRTVVIASTGNVYSDNIAVTYGTSDATVYSATIVATFASGITTAMNATVILSNLSVSADL